MSPGSTRQTEGGRRSRAQPLPVLGFTLVELLVVLLIIAIISGVLLSGFERVLDIRQRLAAFLDGVEAPVLVADWFRSSIGGLVADAANGADRFAGSPRSLTGLSLAPLRGPAGVPTRITWEVAFDASTARSVLRYRNGKDPPMTVASWPGDRGALRYCSAELICRETWPPNPDAPQLPQFVRLDVIKGDAPWLILAAPQSDRTPLRTSADEL